MRREIKRGCSSPDRRVGDDDGLTGKKPSAPESFEMPRGHSILTFSRGDLLLHDQYKWEERNLSAKSLREAVFGDGRTDCRSARERDLFWFLWMSSFRHRLKAKCPQKRERRRDGERGGRPNKNPLVQIWGSLAVTSTFCCCRGEKSVGSWS